MEEKQRWLEIAKLEGLHGVAAEFLHELHKDPNFKPSEITDSWWNWFKGKAGAIIEAEKAGYYEYALAVKENAEKAVQIAKTNHLDSIRVTSVEEFRKLL